MARPKKNQETNTDDLISQLIETVTDTYLNPPENTADENGRMYLNLLAEEFSMTPIKVRKLLISSGVYQTDISMRINELYKSGKTIKEMDYFVMDNENANPQIKIENNIAPKLEQCDTQMLDMVDSFIDGLITYKEKLSSSLKKDE